MTDAVKPDQRRAGGWVVVWGVLLIVAGILAIVIPAPAALAFALVLGVAARVRRRRRDRACDPPARGTRLRMEAHRRRGHACAGRRDARVAGGWPSPRWRSLFGAFLFASGMSTVMLALKLRPKAGWGWVLFDGVLSIGIAVLIALGWPQNSIAFVGILVGICMISGGFWRIMLGRAVRAGQANPA